MGPKAKPKASSDIFAQPKAKAKAKGKARCEMPDVPAAEVFSAPSVKKSDQVNFVNQLKNISEKDENKASKQEVLDFYESLSLRDPQKREVVAKWLSDKTCQWKNEFISMSSTEHVETKSKVKGHATMYEIAKQVSLDPEIPDQMKLLQNILDEFPSDMDWDEDDPYEKGCKAGGLRRYQFEKKTLSKQKDVQSEKSMLVSSKDGKSKTQIVDHQGGSQASGVVTIVIKNPVYHELKSEMAIICIGEAKLCEALSECKKLLPKLRSITGSGGRVDEVLATQAQINDSQDEIIAFVCNNESLNNETCDDVAKPLLVECLRLKKECLSAHETWLAVQKKMRAFIESQ